MHNKKSIVPFVSVASIFTQVETGTLAFHAHEFWYNVYDNQDQWTRVLKVHNVIRLLWANNDFGFHIQQNASCKDNVFSYQIVCVLSHEVLECINSHCAKLCIMIVLKLNSPTPINQHSIRPKIMLKSISTAIIHILSELLDFLLLRNSTLLCCHDISILSWSQHLRGAE